MTLFWNFIFYSLVIETLVACFLCLPSNKVQKMFINGMNQLFSNQKIMYFATFYFGLLMLSLFEAIRTNSIMMNEYESHKYSNTHVNTDIHVRMFRAQRNIYISFFSMFQYLVVYRLTNLIKKDYETYEDKSNEKTKIKSC